MCIFTYTHLECGHRQRDHIDTSSCEYFEQTGVHCQPDNRQHRERGTKVRTGRRDGRCTDCLLKAQKKHTQEDPELAAALEESRKTAEWEQKAREAAQKAQEQKRKDDQERADRVLMARLEEDRKRLKKEEAERKKRRKAEKLRAEEEKRQQDELQATEDAARRQKEADAARRKKERAELQAERERLNKKEHERNLRKLRKEEARLRDQEEAEHQRKLQAEKDELERKARQLDEEEKAERRQEEQLRSEREAAIEREELARRRKEIADRNEALRKAERAATEAEKHARAAAHTEKLAQQKAGLEAAERENLELQAKLASRRHLSESHTPPPQTASLSPPPSFTPTPSTPKPVIDYSAIIGHHGTQELGHGMLGNRRIPVHSSQKPVVAAKPPVPLPMKSTPAPVGRLAGTVTSGPNDYMIAQPSIQGKVGEVPEWKRTLHSRAGSRGVLTPEREEQVGVSELEARLARRRAWEAEQAREEGEGTGAAGKTNITLTNEKAQTTNQNIEDGSDESEDRDESDDSDESDESDESDGDWEVVTPSPQRTRLLLSQREEATSPSGPLPTYPPVPPLAHPVLTPKSHSPSQRFSPLPSPPRFPSPLTTSLPTVPPTGSAVHPAAAATASPTLATKAKPPPPTKPKPKPPVPAKRMSSFPSPVPSSSPASIPLAAPPPSLQSISTPTIPPAPPLPALKLRQQHHMRIDSAAPSPALHSNTTTSNTDAKVGSEGAWDAADRHYRAERRREMEGLGDDVFGEQRRKGWKGE
ncbi:hypothetical protein SVAN01_09511 [Stagonosporopsis vannaccii]|nr:hypothetical protein SVAN01_09511 [Stagonosporopsis vannaccii]